MKPETLQQIPYLIITALSLYIAFTECSRKPCPEPQTIIVTDTIHGDSIPVPYPVVQPQKDSIIYDTEYLDRPIDTAEILKDYFARVYGRDTLANDTSVLVYVDWMVTMNELIYIRPYIQNRKPTAIITQINHVYPKEKTKTFGLAAGLNAYVSPMGSDIAPSLKLRYNKLYFGYGYGVKGSHLVSINYEIF